MTPDTWNVAVLALLAFLLSLRALSAAVLGGRLFLCCSLRRAPWWEESTDEAHVGPAAGSVQGRGDGLHRLDQRPLSLIWDPGLQPFITRDIALPVGPELHEHRLLTSVLLSVSVVESGSEGGRDGGSRFTSRRCP